MASHQIVLISLLIFFVVFCHSVGQELKGKDLMQKVCKNTEFYPECIRALDSNPDTAKAADTTALARISMLEAGIKLRSKMLVVDEMLNHPEYEEIHDPRVLASLAFCRDSYKSGAEHIQEGINRFDQKKYEQAYKLVEKANKAVLYCNNQGVPNLQAHNGAAYALVKDSMMIIKMLH